MPPIKPCSKCRKPFPATVEFFHRHSGNRNGLQNACKGCQRRDSRVAMQRRRNDPVAGAQWTQYLTTWKRNNQSKVATYNRTSRAKRYGLTLAELHAMIATRKGKCDICRRKPKQLFIDHCHTTGRVRGLLCSTCNTAIGLFQDSQKLLLAASRYLQKKGP